MRNKIKNWIDKNITIDLTNKNVFITGGNSGIGFETAKCCAYLKANLFLLVRNLEKGNLAKKEILKEYPNTNITLIRLDLASFKSIKECVIEVKKYNVDVFINNAGVYRLPKSTTKDELEITIGTNFIGTKYLNDLLNEYFVTLNHKVTNVFTSSLASKLCKANYKDFFLEKNYSSFKAYCLSKYYVNDLYYYYLDKYKNTNITMCLTHPGASYTPLIKKGYTNKVFEKAASGFMRLFFHLPDKASLSNLYAINSSNNVIVGPRGLFEISGYPHISKFKKNKNYLKTIDVADYFINNTQ